MTMDSIKAYILAHGLTPGSPLPTEAALCAELGVSRSSVREAMRRLEALDIVRSQRGSGSYVGDMSMRPLVETLVLRSALDVKGGASSLSEVIAIRKALDLGIGAELVAAMKGTKNPELEKLVTSMREHAEAGDTYYDDDIAFHSTLIKQLHNTMLEQLISAMWLIHQTVTPSLHLRFGVIHPEGPAKAGPFASLPPPFPFSTRFPFSACLPFSAGCTRS